MMKDITLNEVVLRLSENGLSSSTAVLLTCGYASGAGPLRKTAHALEQERDDLLKRRQAWFDGQLDLNPAKLVFIVSALFYAR